MALRRCHIFNRTVTMLIVVPGNKLINPGARCFDSFERLAWIGRRVLECTEQAFRVWVVVAHRWSAERWHYAQSLQRKRSFQAVIDPRDRDPSATGPVQTFLSSVGV